MKGEVEMNPLHVNMLVGGGVWEGAELDRRGGGRLAGGWERQGPHGDKWGNSNPWWSQPRRFCESVPGSGRSRRSVPNWNRWSTLVSPYLPHESTRSRGNVGGPEGNAIDKSQVVVGGTLVEGMQAS